MEELVSESISLLAKPSKDIVGQRLGSFGAVFIMLKSALGAGLLNFPWAFARTGEIRYAVTIEMISVVFLISGLIILGYSSSISGQSTYQDVVQHLCGPVIGKLCEIFLVFNLFMISVAFLVIVADQLQKLSVYIYELINGSSESEMPHHWYTDQRIALFILCLFLILPLSIPKEIWIQKYTSVLGTLAAIYLTVVITVKYYIRAVPEHPISSVYSSGISSWTPVFSVIPTICFGFQCHEACIAIYSSLENKKLSHWVGISFVSMFFCTVIYSLTGIYGYLTFGKNVAADVLMSYSGGDVIIIIARLLFGLSIITIYPIVLLLGRSVILAPVLQHRGKYLVVTTSFESCTRVALTLAWVISTFLIAVAVPDISKVISVIGGISAFFIFIFPGMHLSHVPMRLFCLFRWALIAWGVIMLLCGMFIFGQSTSIAIMQILNKM
uniref:Amino acid transporter transmembrane domain-containing protein n=1 Tax=Electrophorus electricus TaxID=8005 RepID=A0AAY5EY19_ELEEL